MMTNIERVRQRSVARRMAEQSGKMPSAKAAKGRPSRDCPKCGETYRLEKCQGCRGTVFKKCCACTDAAKAIPVASPPRLARDIPDPYTGPIKRNLLYHVWPVAGNGTWRRNVQLLLKRFGMFNGRRVVAIVTDDRSDSDDDVRRAFAGHDVEFIVMPNVPKMREMQTWNALWDRVAGDDPNAITFYAHAKGVTHPVGGHATAHDWAGLLWEACVDYLPLAEEQLTRFPIAGCFKKIVTRAFQESASAWHYSGTFFWVRQKHITAERLALAEPFWAGNEAWPGVAFHRDDGGCLFFEKRQQFDLYKRPFWDSVIAPSWEAWKKANAQHRRAGI